MLKRPSAGQDSVTNFGYTLTDELASLMAVRTLQLFILNYFSQIRLV